MVRHILPLIPKHIQYVEPFIGGASVFFAKEKSQCEVINDYDERVTNFWHVLQTDFENLRVKIQGTLYSELAYAQARNTLKDGLKDNRLDFAWAFWVQTNMSFSHKLFAGFAFGNDGDRIGITQKRDGFTHRFHERIKQACIFNRDAIDLIKLKDTPNTFMYFDPPYAESNCGHYEDKKDVYYRLLDILPTLKCKWLMSSYPSEQLTGLRASHGFHSNDIKQNLSVDAVATKGKTKLECLTWNYNLDAENNTLFSGIGANEFHPVRKSINHNLK